MDKESLIQAYLKGSLNKKQEYVLKKHLSDDSDFKAEFEYHKALHETLKLKEAKALKAQLNTIESRVHRTGFKASYLNKLLYSVIAAVVVIGLAISFVINRTKDYFETYYQSYPNVYQPIVRGEEGNYSDAFQAYENKAYLNAEKAFSNILQTEDNPNLLFYQAMSQIELQKYDEAIQNLERLSIINFDFNRESQWYLALLYLKDHNTKKAYNQLVELQKNYPKYNQTVVAKIISEIK